MCKFYTQCVILHIVCNLRCFVASKFLSPIYALLRVKFAGLKICKDKYQVCNSITIIISFIERLVIIMYLIIRITCFATFAMIFWIELKERWLLCNIQYAICNMQYSICNMQYAICNMQYAANIKRRRKVLDLQPWHGGIWQVRAPYYF